MSTSAAAHRRWLTKMAREADRERLRRARRDLKTARELKRTAKKRAREACSAARAKVRNWARTERLRVREEVARLRAGTKTAIEAAREEARTTCSSGRARAQAEGNAAVLSAREKLTAQRAAQKLERIWTGPPARKSSTARERALESDDEVRNNLSGDELYLWEKVKARIKPRERMTRTEAFQHWVHENPGEVSRLLDQQYAADVQRLVREEAKAREAMRPASYAKASDAQLTERITSVAAASKPPPRKTTIPPPPAAKTRFGDAPVPPGMPVFNAMGWKVNYARPEDRLSEVTGLIGDKSLYADWHAVEKRGSVVGLGNAFGLEVRRGAVYLIPPISLQSKKRPPRKLGELSTLTYGALLAELAKVAPVREEPKPLLVADVKPAADEAEGYVNAFEALESSHRNHHSKERLRALDDTELARVLRLTTPEAIEGARDWLRAKDGLAPSRSDEEQRTAARAPAAARRKQPRRRKAPAPKAPKAPKVKATPLNSALAKTLVPDLPAGSSLVLRDPMLGTLEWKDGHGRYSLGERAADIVQDGGNTLVLSEWRSGASWRLGDRRDLSPREILTRAFSTTQTERSWREGDKPIRPVPLTKLRGTVTLAGDGREALIWNGDPNGGSGTYHDADRDQKWALGVRAFGDRSLVLAYRDKPGRRGAATEFALGEPSVLTLPELLARLRWVRNHYADYPGSRGATRSDPPIDLADVIAAAPYNATARKPNDSQRVYLSWVKGRLRQAGIEDPAAYLLQAARRGDVQLTRVDMPQTVPRDTLFASETIDPSGSVYHLAIDPGAAPF